MAAREHQGLQIALIIFVGLTMLLSGTTFMFFRNLEEEQLKVKTADASAGEKDKAMRAAIEEVTEMKRILGAAQKDSLADVQKMYKADMAAFAANLPEAEHQYRKLVADLHTQVLAANEAKRDYEGREREFKAKIVADETQKVAEQKNYTDNVTKANKELATERDQFNKNREEMKKAGADLAKKMDDKRKELDELAKKTTEEIQKLMTDYKGVITVNAALVKAKEEDVVSTERADGKVTWVNQKGRVVWLALGSDDMLKRQTSFSVFGIDDDKPLDSQMKGKVEVTRILDRHLSEARILEDDLSNPIMPGDNIFSPAWQPGRAEHFAFAGFMDIDGDGVSDRARVREVVALNGGVVDAEATDDGKTTGQMTVNTKYLILGDAPTEKKSNAIEGYSALVGEAKLKGVSSMSLKEFLDYMGYDSREGTKTLGKGARGSDFKPQLPDGGIQRRAPGNVFDFKPRNPKVGSGDKEKDKDKKSAY
jgi:hypothetical protein